MECEECGAQLRTGRVVEQGAAMKLYGICPNVRCVRYRQEVLERRLECMQGGYCCVGEIKADNYQKKHIGG